MKNTLLPSSAGLLYSLRTLLPVAPDLVLYDMTIGYTGIPTERYAFLRSPSFPPPQPISSLHETLRSYTQSFYTLVSTYTTGHPPPNVHIHLRSYKISDIPTGTTTTDPSLTPAQINAAATPEDRDAFDAWLRARWTEKDELLDAYYTEGEFPVDRKSQQIELKVALKGVDDWVSAQRTSPQTTVGKLTRCLACF